MEDAPTVANLAFVESLYDRYLADPGSVPEEHRVPSSRIRWGKP